MARTFNIGDRVSALDDDIEGVVTAVEGSRYLVETGEGFPFWFEGRELTLTGEMPEVSNYQAYQSQAQKDDSGRRRRGISYSKKGNKGEPLLTVDLHLEKLPPRFRNADAIQVLDYQLDWTRRQIEFAKSKGIARVVVVHGVGEGVLKEEVRTLLRRMGHTHFFDAPYHLYGFGATEVRLS